MQFYILFNSISVISGQWEVDNERLCAMELHFSNVINSFQLHLWLRRINDIGKISRREFSSPEREGERKGSKSGAPAKIGRYHMYGLVEQPFISNRDKTLF